MQLNVKKNENGEKMRLTFRRSQAAEAEVVQLSTEEARAKQPAKDDKKLVRA